MIDNLAISRIGYSTIRFTGTSESGSVAYLIQDSPGSTPSQYATPTGTEEVTPAEPFSFDVAGLTPGEKRVWVGDATEAPSAWMQVVVPDTTLAKAVLWTDPSRQSIDGETDRIIYGRRGGVCHATRITGSGMRTIWEGDAKSCWYAPADADTLSGISTKSSISGRDYYNISNSAWYIQWDFDSDLECDGIGLYVYTSTGNGVAEVLRDRGGTLTKIGEINTGAGSDGPGSTDLTPVKTVYTELSGSFQAGDKLRLKRKDGDTNNVRIFSVILYKTGEPLNDKPFWCINWAAITTTGGVGSSIEWAYNVTVGDSSTFVGNVAHQSPWPEAGRDVVYKVNGEPVTSGGVFFGEVEVYRTASITMNSIPDAASYEMTTSWTESGIRCEHELTFHTEASVSTAYIGMFPGAVSHSEANADGNEVDITADDGSTVQIGNDTQLQIASTPQGRMTSLVLGATVACSVVQATTGTGNKLYANLETAVKGYTSSESIVGSWDLVLGMPR